MSELNSYSYRETSDILILVNRSYVDVFKCISYTGIQRNKIFDDKCTPEHGIKEETAICDVSSLP